MDNLTVIFFTSVFLLFYVYAGYPLLAKFFGAATNRTVHASPPGDHTYEPTITVLMPASLSAPVKTVEVVRFPIAQSVPSTAITGHVTSAIRPLNICRSFFARGRRTSMIFTSLAMHAATKTG